MTVATLDVFQLPGTTRTAPARFVRKTKHWPIGTVAALGLRVDRNDPNGIDERSFRLLIDVLTFVDTIQKGPKTVRIIEQLVDAAGSIGSNREEALGGSSRKEFIRYNEIALRGANETVRWLRVCAAKQLGSQQQCTALLDEASQLARILGRIVVTSKRRNSSGPET